MYQNYSRVDKSVDILVAWIIGSNLGKLVENNSSKTTRRIQLVENTRRKTRRKAHLSKSAFVEKRISLSAFAFIG